MTNTVCGVQCRNIMTHSDTLILYFKTPNEFEKWMEQNHDTVTEIWMKFAKKSSGIVSINYDQALDVALCFGWIDGLANKYDEDFYI